MNGRKKKKSEGDKDGGGRRAGSPAPLLSHPLEVKVAVLMTAVIRPSCLDSLTSLEEGCSKSCSLSW